MALGGGHRWSAVGDRGRDGGAAARVDHVDCVDVVVSGGVKTPPPNLFYPISFIFIGKLEFQLHVVVTSARLKRQTL